MIRRIFEINPIASLNIH